MADATLSALRSALDGMGATPRPLPPALELYARYEDIPSATVDELVRVLASAAPEDAIRLLLSERLQRWDYMEAPKWADGTAANTTERRKRIYAQLAAGNEFEQFCETALPPYVPAEPFIGIAENHEPWYDASDPARRSFYWAAYASHLLETSRWKPESIAQLDRSTTFVLERISDPSRREIYPNRGLIVGHVQSGKTANFTGVIAKAADAGYRLIIVLAGTMNMLRRQTQRRIDKELIGKEFVEEDYKHDDDWAEFVSHGGRPSELGAFDWHRLTDAEGDYRSLRRGIESLEFERFDPRRPFNDSVNLYRAKCRIMVIKKNITVLKRVASDFDRISTRIQLDQIPTLVIDDESDQATINTAEPLGVAELGVPQRTAINDAIRRLLKQLPRAQYVGYTATPFASVFINPDDAEDVFPKDFIGSLERPLDYMGATDFHDLGSERPSGLASNESAFVRGVLGDDEDPANLVRAIDAFILTGAVKIYRERALGTSFKHHTMLVHVSQRVADHRAIANALERLIERAGYLAGDGMRRLEALWVTDFEPVSKYRAPDARRPASFADLAPLVGECLNRLNQDVAQVGNASTRPPRVLILNGTTEASHPDFDRESVWKIVVGGAKLSRGYTVEGLTVSYYRRRAGAADTLMQMGRWFGFRRNYQDLVRLFIGRHEPLDKVAKNYVDLYAAFEAVCRDELEFRGQLERYSKLTGPERITPKQLPPLVPAHYLLPTSKSKMFNARIRFENFGGESSQKTLAPVEADLVQRNERLIRRLLASHELDRIHMHLETVEAIDDFDAYVTILEPADVLQFVEAYSWLKGLTGVMEREIAFMKGRDSEDPEIRDWLFLAPHIDSPLKPFKIGANNLSVVKRQRTASDGRYKVYSEPRHIRAAEFLTAVKHQDANANVDLRRLRDRHRGVFIFYPTSDDEPFVSMGFVLQFPPNNLPKRIAWGVWRPDHEDAVVVDTNGSGTGAANRRR